MSHETFDQDNENQQRQNVLEVGTNPAGHFHAFPGIDFLQVVIKSPAVFCYAEKGENDGSAR